MPQSTAQAGAGRDTDGRTAPSLRPYQVAALEAVSAAREAGQNRVLVQMATGLGKTTVFSSLLQHVPIKAWLETLPRVSGATMLVIAHRTELLDQAAERLRLLNPGLAVSVEQADRHANRFSDVIVASIQTLAARRFARLRRLLLRHQFRIVVVDESQHAPSATYRTALVHLGFLPPAVESDVEDAEAASYDDVAVMTAALESWDVRAPKDRLLVGVTATPNRSDNIGLGCIFQSIAYTYPLKPAIDDGWLVPIVPWVIETAENLDGVHTVAGDFNQGELATAVNTPRRNALAVESWKLHAEGRPTLAFTVDVQHARDLAATFTAAGVRARMVSGETPKDERRETLAAFTRGDLDVIANCAVFTEGVDLPRISCVLMAKPTKSATLFEQCVGRGLRTFPGKANAIVLDLVDVARKHSLQTAAVLYGLPPGLNTNGEDLQVTADALDALREQHPTFDITALQGRYTLAELAARASTFDIWTVPDLGALRDVVAMNWIKTGAETYRLSYPYADGTEILTVEKDLLGHYDVSLTLRTKGGPAATVRQRTIAAQVPTVQAALGLAEAFLLQERRSASRLTDREAPWRSQPASPGQLGMLRALRVPFLPTIRKGEASDKINMAKARQGR